MSSSFTFNYNQFYNYYSDKSNTLSEKTPLTAYYYKIGSSKTYSNNSLKKYIIIDNEKFYVTVNNNKLLFTFPQFINGVYWDFHYHFGLDTTKFTDKDTKEKNKRYIFP
jgi:hypothetical protein